MFHNRISSRTILTRELTPTFVMLSDIVARRCLNNGSCPTLRCIKAKQSRVLHTFTASNNIHSIRRQIRSKKSRSRSLRKSIHLQKLKRIDKGLYQHHVDRLSRDSTHRCRLRCFAGGIWRLPPIRHHRSIPPDGLPHVPSVRNSHGIERVSRNNQSITSATTISERNASRS